MEISDVNESRHEAKGTRGCRCDSVQPSNAKIKHKNILTFFYRCIIENTLPSSTPPLGLN